MNEPQLNQLLIVDDDAVDRLMVRELLLDKYVVYEAKDSLSAWEAINKSSVNCVLLDYNIPGTDSMALLSEFVQHQLPVIVLTGEGNENLAVNAMKKGAQDYINKRDLSDQLLMRTISNAVQNAGLKHELAEKHLLLAQKVSELEQANTGLETILHISAHDLREPLKNLYNQCDLLQRISGSAIPPESIVVLNSIRRNAKRLGLLIDELRALSRASYLKISTETVPLNKVVEEILSDLNITTDSTRIKIIMNALPEVQACKPFMRELLQNLINNALKYGDTNALCIEFTAEHSEKEWIIGVKNNGSYISPADREKIFMPFFRPQNAHDIEGTGMGLAICQKIAERHDGRIWLECPGHEIVHFKFSLPMH